MGQVSAQISVTTSATLLWQTSTGESPDTAISGQVFRAAAFPQSLPILVVNQGTGSIYVGGSAVTTSTGTLVVAGGSFTYNVTGNDSMYAVAGSTQTVGVCVGGQ